jgi:CBS domain-containing protein
MPKAFDFSNPPFDRLRPAEVDRVEANVDVEFFRAGTVLLRPGDLPDYYYIVIKGLVEERSGGEIVTVHGQGDGFDSNILVNKSCRHEFAVREEAICYLLPIEDFIELTANNAAFGLYFFQSLSQKLDSLTHRQASPDALGALTTRVRQAAIHPALHVEPTLTLHEAAVEMDRHGQRALLTRIDGRAGIVTGVDLTRAAVRDRLPLETPIGELAKLELLSVQPDDFLFQAAYLMARRKVRHLVVVEGGEIVGILDSATVLSSLASQSDAIGALMERSATVGELAEAGERLTQLVRQLHENGTKIGFVTELSSDLHRRLAARLFACLAPPELARHACLVVMGSEGRGEYLLKTDQDNGLIIADDLDPAALGDFRERFTDAMIEVGFPACPGEIMVRNPEWSRPVREWRDALRRWVREPGEQALMNIAIFYDAAAVAGDPELLHGLKAHLFDLLRENAAFHARFAKAIDMFGTPVGMFASLVTERGKHEGELDIKKGGIFPLMHGVRALALERRLVPTNTIQRIRQLHEEGLFDKAFAQDLVDAYSFMMGLRLSARLEKMRLHKPLDNFVRVTDIGKLERDLLKDSLLVVKKLKEVVRHHFRLAVFG